MKVNGRYAGTTCASCFNRKAEAMGYSAWWEVAEDHFPTCTGNPCAHVAPMMIQAESATEYWEALVEVTGSHDAACAVVDGRQAMGVTEADLRSQLPADAVIVVNHYRNVNEDDFVQLPKYRALDAGYTLATRGGFTIVTIENPRGHEVATGLAVCSPTDNYCRAEGRVLALERAVKAWHVGLHISREQVLHVLGVDLLSDPRPWPGEGPR
jgi:hypothetical protein